MTAADSLLDRRDWDAVPGLDGPATTELVDRAASRYLTQDPLLDYERLISLGVRLSRAPHQAASDAVLAWLSADPTAARFEAATGLLLGLWGPAGGGVQTTDERVGRFLDLHDRLPAPSTRLAEYLFLRVLVASASAAHPGESLRTALRAAATRAARTLPEPEGRPLLDQLDRALG